MELDEVSRTRIWGGLTVRAEVALAVYVALIVGAEVTTVLISPGFGVFSHLVVLTALIVHSALVPSLRARRILLPLALGPLTRVLSLSMPLNLVLPVFWYPLAYTPIFLAALVVMRNLRMGRSEVGLVMRKLSPQLLIGLTGLGLGVVEYIILRPSPLAGGLGLGIAFPALVLIVTTGFVEELVFRGIMQRALLEGVGRRGILYVAVVFSVLHIGYLSALDVAFVFGVSLFFAWLRERTGSLLGIALAHGLTNVVLYLVAPFLM